MDPITVKRIDQDKSFPTHEMILFAFSTELFDAVEGRIEAYAGITKRMKEAYNILSVRCNVKIEISVVFT